MKTAAALVYDCRLDPPTRAMFRGYQPETARQKTIDTIRDAIKSYFGKYEVLPAEIIAHADLAAAVGESVDGITVTAWTPTTKAPICRPGWVFIEVPRA